MAEELTRSLEALADRGEPRGAQAVLESARADSVRRRAPWREAQPAWVGAAAFAATLLVLGGSLFIGLALRQPQTEVGSGWVQVPSEPNSNSTMGWLLIPAIALTVAIVALIVRRQLLEVRKERAVATTIEKTSTEQLPALEASRKTSRRLLITIIVLAVALVAMAAWVIYDQAAEPAAAPTAEVQALYDDYLAAWNNADFDAFIAVTTDDYIFNSFNRTFNREEQGTTLTGAFGNVTVEQVGDLMMTSSGDEVYLAAAETVRSGVTYYGVSAYRIEETDTGLKVAQHFWVGDL